MNDHPGHTPDMSQKPDAAKKDAPAKPDLAKQSTPAKADPHAGHDMGRADKSGTPPKAVERK